MLAPHFTKKKGRVERSPPVPGARKSVAALNQSNLGSYVTPSQEPSAGLGRWILLAVLVLSAVLRVWGIGFGLPHLEARPDEMEVVPRAIRLLSGDLNPHFFNYPSLYFYLLGAVFGAWSGITTALGSSMEDFLNRAAVDPSRFILVARYITAVAGVATVLVVYRVGVRLHGRTAGLLGAGLLAVCHLHVRESHFATTDVTLSLFIIWTVYFLLDVAEKGKPRAYVLAGLFTGLAISTKYVGLVLPGALLLAHASFHLKGAGQTGWRRGLRAALADYRPWAFAGAVLVAFVITSPFAILDWAFFTTQFKFQLGHLSGGHGLDLGIGGPYHLLNTFPRGLGWPAFLAGLIGAGWALARHPRQAGVLLAFPLLFYASTFTGRTLFLRYMLPVLPFLCLTAGWWIAHVSQQKPQAWRWAILGGVFLAVAPFADVVETNRRLSRMDTRVEAATWLEEELAGEATTVFQTGARWGWLQLPLPTDSLNVLLTTAARARPVEGLERLRAFSLRSAEARVEESLRRGGGFSTSPYDPETGFESGAPPEWIVLLRSPLEQYSLIPDGLIALLEQEYEPAKVIRTTIPGREGWYDQHDSFYLPFTGIRSVDRPGPDVTLYRRIAVPDSLASPPNQDPPPEEAR